MTHTAAVTGTCLRCGCELGYQSTRRDGIWYCCGACADTDRCTCGCKPDLATRKLSDLYIPLRRMYAARPPDELKRREPDAWEHRRAFPFFDPARGV